MLVVFSPIFVADTKISFVYNFAPPLILENNIRLLCIFSFIFLYISVKYQTFVFALPNEANMEMNISRYY